MLQISIGLKLVVGRECPQTYDLSIIGAGMAVERACPENRLPPSRHEVAGAIWAREVARQSHPAAKIFLNH